MTESIKLSEVKKIQEVEKWLTRIGEHDHNVRKEVIDLFTSKKDYREFIINYMRQS